MTMVQVASLGLCEHCGELLSIEDLPTEPTDEKWHCPSCRGELSHESFGYRTDQGDKFQWVGPDCGNWDVRVAPPTY
jgi:hypothetical protein